MTREEDIKWLNRLIESRKDSRGDTEIDTALKDAVKYLKAWNKVIEDHNNLLINRKLNRKLVRGSIYWLGIEDMWKLIDKHL